MSYLALHIPDGFLPPWLALAGWLIATVGLAWSLWGRLEDDEIPLAGLLSAFIFAAQTFQFPIPGGTTGHLLGATLAVILVGPTTAVLVLTAVVLLQCLLFQEGGLLAMGWNVVNIAFLSGLAGGAVYQQLTRFGLGRGPAAFLAGWLATLFGSLSTCLTLAAAGTSPLLISLPAMLTTQGLVGLLEGFVTAAAVSFVARARPQLLKDHSVVPGLVCLSGLLAACYLPQDIYGLGQPLPPQVYVIPAILIGPLVLAGLVSLRQCQA